MCPHRLRCNNKSTLRATVTSRLPSARRPQSCPSTPRIQASNPEGLDLADGRDGRTRTPAARGAHIVTAAIHVVPGAHRDWNRQERWRPRARTLSDHHNVLPLAEAKKVTFAGARAEPLREAIDLSLWGSRTRSTTASLRPADMRNCRRDFCAPSPGASPVAPRAPSEPPGRVIFLSLIESLRLQVLHPASGCLKKL